MYPSFAHESKLLTILFLCYLLVHLPFAKPMPIIFARGIKCPFYPLRDLVTFMRVGEMGTIWITSNLQPHVPVQVAHKIFSLQLLEVIVVRRENY
jgi:hypothetical protein